MDQQELIITFIGSFLAALAVVAIERWWTAKSDFRNSIKGLINEIEIDASWLEELKETILTNLSNFEKIKTAGGVMNLPPLILLHDSFDYCRIKGIFSDLPEDQRTKINGLYVLSDMITTITDRDFQLSVNDSDHPGRLYSNKKRTWEAILRMIEEYKRRTSEINLQNVIKL